MALLHSVTPEKLLFDEINGLTENTFLDWLQKRNFQDSFRRFDVFMSYKNHIGTPWKDIIEAIPLDDFKNYIQALRDQGYVGRFGSVIPPEKFSLYFPSSQVLYRWIPKNACTSVKKLFIQGEPESIDLKVREHRFHETVQERFGVEQSIIIQNSGFTTVAIIRDPILRIISCYLDKFALPVVDNRPFEGFIKDHIKRYIQLNRIEDLRTNLFHLLSFWIILSQRRSIYITYIGCLKAHSCPKILAMQFLYQSTVLLIFQA